jgi:CubicO group peptidase (beta-lactamase class C family)
MKLSRRSALVATGLGLLASRSGLARLAATVAQESVLERLPDLDKLTMDMMKQTGVPGLSIGVVSQDKVVYLKGFGVRQAAKPEAVDADTVFQLASLSKPIASTVVAALVGDALVAWDDPIIRHDPTFAMHDAWTTREVTLRDMFCHRSGLPDHAGDALEDIGYGRAEVLHRLRYIRPDSSFRSHYAYTNFGLTAAAVAAAKASGKSWENLSAERVYEPLGMKDTSSRFSDFMKSANRASGHVREGRAWVAKHIRDADVQSPAGGVSSSVRDMASWVRLQLGRGAIDHREIVNAAALDETHRPQIVSVPTENPTHDRANFYGLGWNIGYDEQARIRWSHSGAFALGAATCVNLLPMEQLGIVVMTNASPIGLPEAICKSFLDLALASKVEKDWLALFGKVFEKINTPTYGATVDYSKPPKRRSSPLQPTAYAGAYENDLYGAIEIVGADDRLVLKFGPKRETFPLRHFDRDVFTYQPVGENAYGPSTVTFTLAANQKAASATIECLDSNGQGTFNRSH